MAMGYSRRRACIASGRTGSIVPAGERAEIPSEPETMLRSFVTVVAVACTLTPVTPVFAGDDPATFHASRKPK